MIKFFVENTNKLACDGMLQYIVDERSFTYEPWGDSDFSIIIGKEYASLEVSIASSTVLYVSGLTSMDNWLFDNISVPSANKGLLKISNCQDLLYGTGMNYKRNWITMFDQNTHWVCISQTGTNHASETYVEFAHNSIAAVKNGELTGVWLKPMFI